jgi:hypothetical protein
MRITPSRSSDAERGSVLRHGLGRLVAAAVVVVAGTAALTAPANAATVKAGSWTKVESFAVVNGKLIVRPDSDWGCTGGENQGNMEGCVYIQGQSNVVDWVHGVGTATNDGEDFNVFIFYQDNSGKHLGNDSGYGYTALDIPETSEARL